MRLDSDILSSFESWMMQSESTANLVRLTMMLTASVGRIWERPDVHMPALSLGGPSSIACLQM